MRQAILIALVAITFTCLQAFAQAVPGEYNTQLEIWGKHIKRHWFPPKCGPCKAPRIRFDLMADGSVQNIRIEESSDHADADREAIKAIKNSQPFAPIPKEWGKEKITLHGNFKVYARKGYQFLEID